jgi:hypothetical protein
MIESVAPGKKLDFDCGVAVSRTITIVKSVAYLILTALADIVPYRPAKGGCVVKVPSSIEIEAQLFQQYGGLLDSATTARVLGYPTADSLTKARRRGALSLPMMRIAHRRGWWTTPHELACYLTELKVGSTHARGGEECRGVG